MSAGRVSLGAVLVLLTVSLTACDGLSCWTDLPPTGNTLPPVTAAASTTAPPATVATSTTLSPATGASTTTTVQASALDIYRDQMRAWKNRYAADMQENYNILSDMSNPLEPTDQQVKAARTLADLMDDLVADLKAVQAPVELSSAHAAYVASLDDMHGGVDRLAAGLENGGFMGSIDIARAFTTIYAADRDGNEPRTALEQALGFSLTSAD